MSKTTSLLFFLIVAIQLNGAIDSLINQLKLSKNDTAKIELIIAISAEYTEMASFDSAKSYAQKAIYLSQNQGRIAQNANAHYAMGYLYDIQGALDSAIYHYERCRSQYAAIDNKIEVANAINAKGVAAYYQGEYDVALNHYLEALSYVEQHGIDGVLSKVLNNLGIIYRISDNNDDAIEIYKKNLKLARRLGNEEMEGTTFHNLGVAYGFNKNADTAFLYLDSSILKYQALKIKNDEALSWIAKGEVHYEVNKNYKSAEIDLLKGLRLLGSEKSNQESVVKTCLLYTSPSPRDLSTSRMPSSA